MANKVFYSGGKQSPFRFFAVAVVLLLVVLAAVYIFGLQPKSNVADKKSDKPVASKNESKSTKAKSSTVASDSKAAKQSNGHKSSSKDSKSTNSVGTSKKDQGVAVAAPSTSVELPQTGPRDNLMNILVLSVLATSIVYFLQSRRRLATDSIR